MTEQSNAELITEVNEKLASHQWTSDWGIEMLAGILAEHLEAADQRATEAEAERDRAKSGAKTLGEIVERQIEDTLRWAGMEDQIGLDDPDQQTAWELCAEMPEKIARLTAEREHLAAVVEKVRETLAGMAKRYTDNSDAAYFTRSIEAILATAPADALRERDAEKRGEGAKWVVANQGHELNAYLREVIDNHNPYRTEADRG